MKMRRWSDPKFKGGFHFMESTGNNDGKHKSELPNGKGV